ncbi:MAG: tRNA 2-thiouridine(34) synthase MnmA [Bellilinea sp.]|jgi:tRNA-specific 2-thiouridylase
MGNGVVAVAMSGGVDSSVAAALLVEEGYSVFGVMLRLWSEPGKEDTNRCCTPDAMSQARKVAARLKIPFYPINAQEIFYDVVVQSFIKGYASGKTPNPCLMCNRIIRWDYMLRHVQALGAEKMATGHYARLRIANDGQVGLYKGKDLNKDQSYVLSVLDQVQLSRTVLPVGEHTKAEVREMARRFGLPVAERQDSQDLCFLAGQDYRIFLERHAVHLKRTGKIISSTGQYLGEHQGLGFYTIGQRKGLGMAAGKPLYVVEKRIEENILVVGEEDELGFDRLTTGDVNWIGGCPPAEKFNAEIKIRYKANPVAGEVSVLAGNRIQVWFSQPLRDITPGQRAVLYRDEQVLGGGIIERAEKRGKL